MSTQIYEIITDRVCAMLEAGTIPWRKGWAGGDLAAASAVSRKEYRGVNQFLLRASGYASPFWLSFNQARERGGSVRKGEKGMPVVFWKQYEREDQDGAKRKVPVLRYYTVFNVAQIDGLRLDLPAPEIKEHRPIEEAEAIVANMPNRPAIIHGEARAFFRPALDVVNMPAPGLFDMPEEYYAVLFHELTHSTGHETRLNRRPSTEPRHFGDTAYAREELVAEMGAAFLCGVCGIERATLENSAAYIASWLKALRNDPKAVVIAAAQAQRAADYIRGISYTAQATSAEAEPANFDAAA